jgi:polyphosphate kinase
LRIVAAGELSAEQREAARRRFLDAIFAALTPLAVDPGHPFPRLRGGPIHVAALLRRRDAGPRRRSERHAVAIVKIPPDLPRLVPIPSREGIAAVLLEDVVADCVAFLFPGQVVAETAAFRVTSDRHASGEAHGERRSPRRTGARLEVGAGASDLLVAALAKGLRLAPGDVDRVQGPLRPADLPPSSTGGDGTFRPDDPGPSLRAG